jgi:guanyl-specific ribonuclease Sa
VSKWTRLAVLIVAALAAANWWSSRAPLDAPAAGAADDTAPTAAAEATRFPSFLPPEAIATIEAIERGGPFPYDRDGTVFQNREGLLPGRPRGYYREYTVQTPGSRDRGARRIVTGGQPPEVYYYTDDHYRSFDRVEIRR